MKPSAPVAVSVIVTAHNYGRFLDQCVTSVLGQTYPDFELIVVDDGSVDETPSILEKYARDPKVSIHRLARVGLAAACNYGIRRSQGEFVLRLDADDFLDPHALSVEAGILNRHPKIDLVYPDFYTVDEAGQFLGYTRVPRIQEGARLLDNNPLAGGAMYRRTCYDDIGGYNESLRYQEDYDFWLRFTERFQVYGVGLPLLFYRQHAGSMSRNRANRSAARRHVKRQYASTRRLATGREALIVIPGIWPGAPARPQEILCRSLGTTSALRLVLDQARTCEASQGVLVVTKHPEIKRTAESAGVEVLGGSIPESAGFERSELSWLHGLVQTWSASHPVADLLVLASPYCPLRHPERIREAIDTLLIHNCDLVVAVDSESVTPWAVGSKGLRQLSSGTGMEGPRIVREAGELLAVRTDWLKESRPLRESVVGYVEMLYPEWWCLTDEAAWRACTSLLPQAEALNSPASAYLCVEG